MRCLLRTFLAARYGDLGVRNFFMFKFLKYEKVVLIILCLAVLSGLGFSAKAKKAGAASVSLETSSFEKTSLKAVDGIIQRYSVININTALADELEKLKGIGPALAERIIEYRRVHGPFSEKSELLRVKGIGPKIYERIKDNISVN